MLPSLQLLNPSGQAYSGKWGVGGRGASRSGKARGSGGELRGTGDREAPARTPSQPLCLLLCPLQEGVKRENTPGSSECWLGRSGATGGFLRLP